MSTYWFGDSVYDANTFPVVGSSIWKVNVCGYRFSRYTSPEDEEPCEVDDEFGWVLDDDDGELLCELDGEEEELCELDDGHEDGLCEQEDEDGGVLDDEGGEELDCVDDDVLLDVDCVEPCEVDEDCVELCELPCSICSGEIGSSPIPLSLKSIVWTEDCRSPSPTLMYRLGI